jgi:Holliday junction DNA helicase RuvA
MIDHLHGIVTDLQPAHITLRVNDSIGFGVSVPNENKFNINQVISLHIHFHWNADNGPTLYGFEQVQDKNVFQLIISCSGIGPKIGLAALSSLSASAVLSAIATNDVKALSSVSGIGTKKAENIIVQLKGKVEKLLLASPELTEDNSAARHVTEVTQVLTTLNYTRQEIGSALDYVKAQSDYQNLAFDGLLRKTLGFLSKRI